MTIDIAPLSHHGWLEARIHRTLASDAVAFEAVDNRGEVRGMVAYEWWSETGAGVHVAVDSPMALRHARGALDFIFQTRDVLWALVAQGSRSLRLALHLGFTVTGTVPGGYALGQDLVLVSLTREAWAARRRK